MVRSHHTQSTLPLSRQFVCKPSNWDPVRQRIRKGTFADKMNHLLLEKKLLLEERIEEEFGLCPAAKASIIARRLRSVRGESEKKVLLIFDEFIALKEVKSTIDSFTQTKKNIIGYDTIASELMFSDLDVEWVKGFEGWMRAKGNKTNTVAIHLENLRAVVNYARKQKFTQTYAFADFEIKRENVIKPIMELAQLHEIWHYDGETKFEQFYLDIYRLMLCFCGINLADLYNLTSRNIVNGRLEFDREKTGVHVSIRIEPEAQEILERWKGKKGNLLCIKDTYSNYKDFLSKLNHNLKTMAPSHWEGHRRIRGEAMWPECSTYMARRSWASLGAGPCQVPIDILALGLGHKDSRMTSVYVRPYLKNLDEANRRILDAIISGSVDCDNDNSENALSHLLSHTKEFDNKIFKLIV